MRPLYPRGTSEPKPPPLVGLPRTLSRIRRLALLALVFSAGCALVPYAWPAAFGAYYAASGLVLWTGILWLLRRPDRRPALRLIAARVSLGAVLLTALGIVPLLYTLKTARGEHYSIGLALVNIAWFTSLVAWLASYVGAAIGDALADHADSRPLVGAVAGALSVCLIQQAQHISAHFYGFDALPGELLPVFWSSPPLWAAGAAWLWLAVGRRHTQRIAPRFAQPGRDSRRSQC